MVLGLQMAEEGLVVERRPSTPRQEPGGAAVAPGGPAAQPRRRTSASPPRGVVSTPEAWSRLSRFQVE